jgi:DegV family protein with EDD domain
MGAKVAVVTDSTAVLPDAVLSEGDGRVVVVPLQVVIDGEAYDDGLPETSPEAIKEALGRHRTVSTSRAAPETFKEVYAGLAAEGVEEIVSIHLSAEMSGTYEAAQLGARAAAVPVEVVDTRAVGPCLGFAVLAAADAVAHGASAKEAAQAAMERAEAARSFFFVDTLEYLRRGGRIGTAAALLGSALAVKPLLAIEDGQVVLHERVRTSARALARLEDLAAEAAGGTQVEVVVAHLGSPDRAAALREHLDERLAGNLGGRTVRCGELGAVLGAHVGPGMLAVVVAPAL